MEPAPTEPEQQAGSEAGADLNARLNGAGSDGAGTGSCRPTSDRWSVGPQWSRLRRSRNRTSEARTRSSTATSLNGAGSDGAGTAVEEVPDVGLDTCLNGAGSDGA